MKWVFLPANILAEYLSHSVKYLVRSKYDNYSNSWFFKPPDNLN